MKRPIWTQTLVWLAAVFAAVLLAFAGPESLSLLPTYASPWAAGANAPR